MATGLIQGPARCVVVCGGKITGGVADRVAELSGRRVQVRMDEDGLVHGDTGRPPFRRAVPLSDIVADALGRGPATKAVTDHLHASCDRVRWGAVPC